MDTERRTKLQYKDHSDNLHYINITDSDLAALLSAIDDSMTLGVIDRGIIMKVEDTENISESFLVRMMDATILEEDFRRICVATGREIDLRGGRLQN